MTGLFFADTVVPPNIGNDAPNWTLGTVITFGAGYTNVAVRARWWFPSAQVLSANALPANIGPVTARLYNDATGALLGSAVFPDTSAGAAPNGTWRESNPFNTGEIPLAGLSVCIGMYKPTGYYPFNGGIFPITGAGYTGNRSRFVTADAAPNSAGSLTTYYADLVTQPPTVQPAIVLPGVHVAGVTSTSLTAALAAASTLTAAGTPPTVLTASGTP